MKKFLYIMMVGAIALSCVKEMGDQNLEGGASSERQDMIFSANNTLTKTSLGENNAVLWSAEDALSVFDGELVNNKFAQNSLSDDLASATFAGTAAVSSNYYAVYPYRSGNASNAEGVIDTYLSPDQFAVSGSFGPKANLALGVSEGNNFQMQQAGAFLKFSFSGCDNVTSICLKAIGGEKISGGVTATYSEGNFTTVSKNDGSSLDEVTLYPVDGTQYIAAGTYYVVMLPVTLNSGIQIIFTEKNGNEEKVISAKVESPIELERNTVSTIPTTISLPDVSNPAWMAQQTLNVLFRAPSTLMESEGATPVWPFEEDRSTYVKEDNTVTDFTLIEGGNKIGMQFAKKSLSHLEVEGFGAWNGSCSKWGIRIPAIEGKKISKVEYYTSGAAQTGHPKLVNAIGGTTLVDGAVNAAEAGYAKYVWNINSLAANTGCFINYDMASSSVFLTGFRVVYRDAEGPSKSVISTKTEKLGVALDQDVKLLGTFVPYDGTSEGYTFGFEYMPVTSVAVMTRSSAESFSGADGYSLRSTQSGEWTSVDATIEEGTTFTTTLNTLARGEAYLVRAWARVGTEGAKVYGNEETFTLLDAVSNGKVWKYGEDGFFTVWNIASLEDEDKANYDWETRVANGESYTYGAEGLLYEATAGTTGIVFKGKNYLKFTSGQKFSFIAAESGTATLTFVCVSTGSSARTISIAVNGTNVTTVKSTPSGDSNPVTSPEFSVNEGDKVSITIGGNANLSSIAYTCSAQAATFDPEVNATRKENRDNVYTFTVKASEGVNWTAAVTTGAGDGVVLNKTAGTGNGEFTLTVPVNMSYSADKSYVVTVSTSDERIAEGNRTREFTLTQGHLTKVLFGCTWGAEFMTGLINNFNATNEKSYTADLATATFTSIEVNTHDLKGADTKFTFVAGESGDGILSFRARIYKTKEAYIKVAGTTVETLKYTTDFTGRLDIPLTVEAGQEISIVMSGSGNHKLYIGSGDYLISWTQAPSEN